MASLNTSNYQSNASNNTARFSWTSLQNRGVSVSVYAIRCSPATTACPSSNYSVSVSVTGTVNGSLQSSRQWAGQSSGTLVNPNLNAYTPSSQGDTLTDTVQVSGTTTKYWRIAVTYTPLATRWTPSPSQCSAAQVWRCE